MLDTKLASALRTTKQKLTILKSLGLETVSDLLEYYPRTYEDVSNLVPISMFSLQEKNASRGFLSPIKSVRTRYGKQVQRATFTDEEGDQIDCIWFNQKHLTRMYGSEIEVIISGKVKGSAGSLTFQSPVIEPIAKEQVHTARIVPVYHETEGISSKWLREKIQSVIDYAKYVEEFLPEEYLKERSLPVRSSAIRQIHFPETNNDLEKARERLAFEEAFLLQANALQAKYTWKQEGSTESIPMNVDLIKSFMDMLPFSLTNAQKITLYEILDDMQKDAPMLRLLQGDVGCGKTIVAAIAALNAVNAGFQCAIMAPTEILAKQHFQKFIESFETFGEKAPRISLLVGSLTQKEKNQMHELIKSGQTDIIVGTHALIQEAVSFHNLGFAIIDEQHRFGVEQRAKLREHGSPHMLMMTATPIPRTLTLTMYGDQDISVIDEMPPGRKDIITRVVRPKDNEKAVLFIADQIKKGRQVFVICPLIEESEKMELKSVTEEYERLTKDVFPEFKINYLHGKMKAKEKDAIMKDFNDKKFDILVSTSVIEVGIDIPNATVMIIQSAERFGLSQLHQFRGRVGRGGDQSYCFLFVTDPDEGVPRRLRAMEQYNDGFKLAEIDLEIRGPGEVYGTRQSGLPDFRLANIMDGRLISQARKFADKILQEDLFLNKFPLLRKKLEGLGSRFIKA
jgi:ATP-dependent DNA helicase RecG